MKKNFTILLFAVLMSTGLYAQIPNGSTAPDFTATDINGNEHTLYADYLDNGKSVILDLSAAWCSPCWSYHQDGLLKDIYNQYGPDATDELQVLFVESESTNTATQLNGTSTGSTRATSTQGDWVTGTPYPIIDANHIAPAFGLTFYPTVMIVRSSGKTLQSYDNDFPINSEFMAYAARNTATNDIMLSGQVSMGNESGCSDVTPSLRAINMGNSEVTSFTAVMRDLQGNILSSFDWTGSMDVFETASVNFPMAILSGSQDVEFEIMNPNGVADEVPTLNMVTVSYQLIDAESDNIDESFEDQTEVFAAPNNFLLNQPANNPIGSLSRDAFTTPPANEVGGYGMSAFSTLIDFYNWNTANVGSTATATSIYNLDLSGVSNGALVLDRAAAEYTGGTSDRMDIEFRIGCDGTWDQVYSKRGSELATAGQVEAFYVPTPSQWVTDTVYIEEYDGMQDVQMRFRFTSNYGNNLYIDNIHTESIITAVEEVESLNGLSIYPNPVSDVLTVDFELNKSEELFVELTNTLGQRVLTLDHSSYPSGAHQIQQDMSNIPNGVYFVTFRNENQVSVHKVSVNH